MRAVPPQTSTQAEFDTMVNVLTRKGGRPPPARKQIRSALAISAEAAGPTFLYPTPTTPQQDQRVLVPWRFQRSGDDDDDMYTPSITTVDTAMTIPAPVPISEAAKAALPKIRDIISRIIEACVLTAEEFSWARIACTLVAPAAELASSADDPDPYAAYLKICRRQYFTVVTNRAAIPDVLLVGKETHETTDLDMRGLGCLAAIIPNGAVFRATYEGREYCRQSRSTVYDALYIAVMDATACEAAVRADPCDSLPVRIGNHAHVPGVCPAAVDLVCSNDELILAIRLSEVERVLAPLEANLLEHAHHLMTQAAPDRVKSRLAMLLQAVCFRVWRQGLADQFHYGISGAWIAPVQAIGPELMNRLSLHHITGGGGESALTGMLTAAAVVIHRICALCNHASYSAGGLPVHMLSPLEPTFRAGKETPQWLRKLLHWVSRATRCLVFPASQSTAADNVPCSAGKRKRDSVDDQQLLPAAEEQQQPTKKRRRTMSKTHLPNNPAACLTAATRPAEAWYKVVLMVAAATISSISETTVTLPKKKKAAGNAWPQRRDCCSLTSDVLKSCNGTAGPRDSYVVGLLLSCLPCCCLWTGREHYKDLASVLLANDKAAAAATTAAATGDGGGAFVAAPPGCSTYITYSQWAFGHPRTEAATVDPVDVITELLVTAAIGARIGDWDGPKGAPVQLEAASSVFNARCHPEVPLSASDRQLHLRKPSKRNLWGVGGVRERTLFITQTETERRLFAAVRKCTSLSIGRKGRVLVHQLTSAAACRSASPSAALEVMPCLTTIASDVGALLGIQMAKTAHAPETVIALALGAHCITASGSRADRLSLPLIYVVVCPKTEDVANIQLRWSPYVGSGKKGAKRPPTGNAPLVDIYRLTPGWVCVLLLCPPAAAAAAAAAVAI